MRRATLSCFFAFLGVATSLAHAQSTQAAQTKAGPSQLTYSEFWQRSHARPSLRHPVSSSHPAAGMPDPATPPNFAGFFATQTLPGIAPVSANSNPIALLTADFNNDGHPDLATVDSRSGVAVSLNDGAGHFGTPIMTSPTSATSALAAMTIDLNGDGFPDLIVVTTTSQISVLINQKNGTFAQSAIVDLANAPPVSAITNFLPFVNIAFTAGVTGNSTSPDIIVEYVVPPSNAQMGAVLYRTVFLNDAAAGFSDATQKTVSTSVNSSYSLHGFEENSVPGRLILADANHDGKPDLFTAASSNGYLVDVALGNGDGTFAPPASNSVVSLPNASTSFLYAPVFTVASLTSNANNQDLILGGDNSIYYAAANGDGTYQAPVLAVQRGKLGSVGTIDFIQIADVNSDGRPDLLVGGSGNLTAYPGNGDGTFGLASSSTVNTNSYSAFPGLVIADFTGDGKLDFADASEYSSDVALGIGNGDGTFAATPVLYSSTLSLSPLLFDLDAAFDLNNDGKTDLIGSNLSDGTIIAALTGPGGKFNYKVALPASPTVYYAPESVFADFNGDGNIDLIFGEGNSGLPKSYGVAVSLSNGDGTFQPPVPIKLPATLLNAVLFNSFAVGDINGDGKPDLVFTYPGDEQQYPAGSTPPGYFVALGNGDGSFAQAVFTPFGATPSYVLLAHYHGNSSPLDLVIADPDMPTSGVPVSQVSLLRGEGDGTFGPPTVILSGFYPYNILSDDFNKDGKPDLTVSAPFDDNFDTTKSALFQLAGHGDGTFASPVIVEPRRKSRNRHLRRCQWRWRPGPGLRRKRQCRPLCNRFWIDSLAWQLRRHVRASHHVSPHVGGATICRELPRRQYPEHCRLVLHRSRLLHEPGRHLIDPYPHALNPGRRPTRHSLSRSRADPDQPPRSLRNDYLPRRHHRPRYQQSLRRLGDHHHQPTGGRSSHLQLPIQWRRQLPTQHRHDLSLCRASSTACRLHLQLHIHYALGNARPTRNPPALHQRKRRILRLNRLRLLRTPIRDHLHLLPVESQPDAQPSGHCNPYHHHHKGIVSRHPPACNARRNPLRLPASPAAPRSFPQAAESPDPALRRLRADCLGHHWLQQLRSGTLFIHRPRYSRRQLHRNHQQHIHIRRNDHRAHHPTHTDSSIAFSGTNARVTKTPKHL